MRWFHSGLGAAVAVLVSGPVGAAPAAAPARPVVEFRWDAPANCPAEAEVVAELERLLGGPLAGRTGPRKTAIARVRQEPGGAFDLRLWTVGDEGTLQRSLAHAECEALARAGALIAAMAIDPSVLERMSGETDTAEVAAGAKTIENPEPPPGPPEPETPEGAKPAPLQPLPTPPAKEGPAPRKIRGAVRVGAGISAGDLPGVGALVRVTPALVWARARLELEVSYGPLRRARFDDRPDQGADLQLASGAVRAGPVLRAGRLEFPLCVGLEFGAVYGRGAGYPVTSEGRQLFAALHFAPAVLFVAHPRVALGVIVEGAVHLVRPRFAVENFGEIYRAAAGSVRALLAIEARFP